MRKIIHTDMDAFFASVEQRDRPEWRGKPVIVGGAPDSRGVVATCSYEARKFGIHSAMASSVALRKCPHGIFVEPRFDVYCEISRQIRSVFHEFTDLVESVSLDEAYLDVTENTMGTRSASLVAAEIKRRIYKTTLLTASAGASYNKFLAKMASEHCKPNGLMAITPAMADRFIKSLKIGKFFGIGKVMEARMHERGIFTGADLQRRSREELAKFFGKSGSWYYDIARGLDEREVTTEYVRKSIGQETTLGEDITDLEKIDEILQELVSRTVRILKKKNEKGRTVTLKVKYYDFRRITRSVTCSHPVDSETEIMDLLRTLLFKTEAGKIKIRLLGVCISHLLGAETEKKAPSEILQYELAI